MKIVARAHVGPNVQQRALADRDGAAQLVAQRPKMGDLGNLLEEGARLPMQVPPRVVSQPADRALRGAGGPGQGVGAEPGQIHDVVHLAEDLRQVEPTFPVVPKVALRLKVPIEALIVEAVERRARPFDGLEKPVLRKGLASGASPAAPRKTHVLHTALVAHEDPGARVAQDPDERRHRLGPGHRRVRHGRVAGQLHEDGVASGEPAEPADLLDGTLAGRARVPAAIPREMDRARCGRGGQLSVGQVGHGAHRPAAARMAEGHHTCRERRPGGQKTTPAQRPKFLGAHQIGPTSTSRRECRANPAHTGSSCWPRQRRISHKLRKHSHRDTRRRPWYISAWGSSA